jgi:hypothetical protein
MIGGYRYIDLDGNDEITEADKTVIGDVNPDFMFGFNNTLTWKNWTFGLFVSGVIGGDIVNCTFVEPVNLKSDKNVPVFLYDQAWRGEGTGNKHRMIGDLNHSSSLNALANVFLEDRTFVRVKNINLAYNFNLKRKSPISSLKVAFNVINPFTFTNYHGYDPEVSASGSSLSRGVDNSSYPQARTYTLNLSCNF